MPSAQLNKFIVDESGKAPQVLRGASLKVGREISDARTLSCQSFPNGVLAWRGLTSGTRGAPIPCKWIPSICKPASLMRAMRWIAPLSPGWLAWHQPFRLATV